MPLEWSLQTRTVECRGTAHVPVKSIILLLLSNTSQVKSTAGLRSTFDRLPYGCLLFMYRLDLTTQSARGARARALTPGGPQPSTGATITILLLLFNTTRARAHTLRTPKHRSHVITLDGGRILLLLFNTTVNAHTLRTPKHGGR